MDRGVAAFPTKRGFTLIEIMMAVVIIGLLASLAIPAFNKVRRSSQDKAIYGNLRQLAYASEQYFTENGTSSASMDALIGADRYIKTAITPVAGEVYPLVYQQGESIIATNVAGGRSVVFSQ